MYTPRQIGIPAAANSRVTYVESTARAGYESILFYTWELASTSKLSKSFTYLVLPDACVDIIFDLKESGDVLVMASSTDAEEVGLGREFHYAGIRLLPGVVNPSRRDAVPQHPAVVRARQSLMQSRSANERVGIMYGLIDELYTEGLLAKNHLIRRLLSKSHDLHTVQDMATLTGYTPRHLQRILVTQTGHSPSALLKILKFQKAVQGQDKAAYADQSHLIRAFRLITKMTPRRFREKYK